MSPEKNREVEKLFTILNLNMYLKIWILKTCQVMLYVLLNMQCRPHRHSFKNLRIKRKMQRKFRAAWTFFAHQRMLSTSSSETVYQKMFIPGFGFGFPKTSNNWRQVLPFLLAPYASHKPRKERAKSRTLQGCVKMLYGESLHYRACRIKCQEQHYFLGFPAA